MIALRVEKNHLCASLTKLRKGGCEPVCDLTAMSASPFRPLGFSRHWEIYHDEARKGPLGGNEERPACACIPALIVVSFHRLFLGGLLPSRARFRFAGCCDGIRCHRSRQLGQRSGA
jgi:hypothetical protein